MKTSGLRFNNLLDLLSTVKEEKLSRELLIDEFHIGNLGKISDYHKL